MPIIAIRIRLPLPHRFIVSLPGPLMGISMDANGTPEADTGKSHVSGLSPFM